METELVYSLICTLGRNPSWPTAMVNTTFFSFFFLGRPVNPAEKSIDINASGDSAGLGILCVSVHTFFLSSGTVGATPFSYRNLVPCPSFLSLFFLHPCSHVIDVIYIQSGEYRAKRAPARTFSSVSSTKRLSASASFLSLSPSVGLIQINNNTLCRKGPRVMVPDSLLFSLLLLLLLL